MWFSGGKKSFFRCFLGYTEFKEFLFVMGRGEGVASGDRAVVGSHPQ